MGIKKPNPEIARDTFNPFQQSGQGRPTCGINGLTWPRFLIPKIHPVVGCVLADQVNFFDTLPDKVANFAFHRVDRSASMPATHLRDYAKTARMVTSFGNLQVGKMPWR